jgi:hypothetical protein
MLMDKLQRSMPLLVLLLLRRSMLGYLKDARYFGGAACHD